MFSETRFFEHFVYFVIIFGGRGVQDMILFFEFISKNRFYIFCVFCMFWGPHSLTRSLIVWHFLLDLLRHVHIPGCLICQKDSTSYHNIKNTATSTWFVGPNTLILHLAPSTQLPTPGIRYPAPGSWHLAPGTRQKKKCKPLKKKQVKCRQR